jgi:CTP synthase
LFCNVKPERVIEAPDIDTIYNVPVSYHEQGLDEQVCKYFRLENMPAPDLEPWKNIVQNVRHPEGIISIAIVGKYMQLKDAYKSLIEALVHAGIVHNVKVQIEWVDSSADIDYAEVLGGVSGVLVPGGFGERGVDGKIGAIKYAREKKIPFLGICFGMQLAVIEAARNLAGIQEASSTEFGPTKDPVVGMMTEWMDGETLQKRSQQMGMGGTMRLGSYPCALKSGSLAETIFNRSTIYERHRHRYEVNMSYREVLEAQGVIFSGLSPDGALPEIIERADHPWFVGVQFHPELKSKPLDPHPLFVSFIQAAIRQERLV